MDGACVALQIDLVFLLSILTLGVTGYKEHRLKVRQSSQVPGSPPKTKA